jgi:hypothetical protein
MIHDILTSEPVFAATAQKAGLVQFSKPPIAPAVPVEEIASASRSLARYVALVYAEGRADEMDGFLVQFFGSVVEQTLKKMWYAFVLLLFLLSVLKGTCGLLFLIAQVK